MINAAPNIQKLFPEETENSAEDVKELLSDLTVSSSPRIGIACGDGLRDPFVLTVDVSFLCSNQNEDKDLRMHINGVTNNCLIHVGGMQFKCGVEDVCEALHEANVSDPESFDRNGDALTAAKALFSEIVDRKNLIAK
ncbi:MAG: hypothetical protein GY804_07255 [Alphaproteobacteria bacterium]|nr:hypothetical protein [Alphaproteobacteria bacterium]